MKLFAYDQPDQTVFDEWDLGEVSPQTLDTLRAVLYAINKTILSPRFAVGDSWRLVPDPEDGGIEQLVFPLKLSSPPPACCVGVSPPALPSPSVAAFLAELVSELEYAGAINRTQTQSLLQSIERLTGSEARRANTDPAPTH